MNQISAAENHTIYTTPTRWRLLQHEQPLAEGTPQGLRYGSRFASSRRLATDDILARENILEVVLGWQHTDEAWHLGLMLAPSLARERSSRWVELVYWPDPDIVVFQELAEQSGRLLAQAIDIPFRLIQPQTVTPAPQRPLPELPLTFGDWTIQQAPHDKHQLLIERSQQWVVRKYGRIGWNFLWMAVYLALSLGTMFSAIALPNTGTLLPNPHWLPYIGLLTVLMLVGIILYNIWQLIRLPNRIVVDGTNGAISAWKNDTMRWLQPRHGIQSVYISEVVKRKEASPATEYGELNLHLGGGEFQFVIAQTEAEENSDIPQPASTISRASDGMWELNRENMHTNLQATALYIAETLGDLPVWYDLRVQSFLGSL